jgi:uncharacterized protein
MIEKSFKFLPGLDIETQRRLHRDGISEWKDFLECKSILDMAPERKIQLDDTLKKYTEALEKENFRYFVTAIPPVEHWRLFERVKQARRLCYMDIETTGLNFFNDDITLIGIFDDTHHRSLVNGINLDEKNLIEALEPFDMIVTHYGLKFDVPFIKYKFPGVGMNRLHFDVSFMARKMELGSSLKEIENNLGIKRADNVSEVNGAIAVKLWEEFQAGKEAALQLLVDHNREDSINLVKVAGEIYKRLVDMDY